MDKADAGGCMKPSLALHTAARRYCLERHAYWCARYADILSQGRDRQPDGYDYTDEALATFPRYNVLNAIRVEVERLDPAELEDLDATRTLLLLAGECAEDAFTRSPLSDIAGRAMVEERDTFCRYITGLGLSELASILGLAYRRVLKPEESAAIWDRLRERWQITDGYWYPLRDCSLPDILAFDANAFDEAVSPAALQRILMAHGINRVWELREYGPEYDQDVVLFEPLYNRGEGYWSSGDLSWIVYASHEASVTVGGWLLREVQLMWPSSQAHIWQCLANPKTSEHSEAAEACDRL